MNTKYISLAFACMIVCSFLNINCLGENNKRVDNDDSKEYKYFFEDVWDSERGAAEARPMAENRNEISRNFNSDIDEELVKKAETAANEDLIGGLNMILKNHETLEDVLRMEGVRQLP